MTIIFILTQILRIYNDVFVQVYGTTAIPTQDMPTLEVKLQDAVPEAFEMVLNYIYTDRIDPSRCKKDQNPNKIVLIMMDVYRLAVQVCN